MLAFQIRRVQNSPRYLNRYRVALVELTAWNFSCVAVVRCDGMFFWEVFVLNSSSIQTQVASEISDRPRALTDLESVHVILTEQNGLDSRQPPLRTPNDR